MRDCLTMENLCFACGRRLKNKSVRVDTRDAQTVEVGPDCAKLVERAGEEGYQPPGGGPRLYPLPDLPIKG